jgi:hypothetical protein
VQSDASKRYFMRAKIVISILISAFVFLVACSNQTSELHTNHTSTVSLATLPVNVEGMLTVDVAEGDVNEEGSSEFNFGTLTVENEDISIQVSGSILQSANLPDEGGKVRATLGSKTEQFGETFYTITSLQRL